MTTKSDSVSSGLVDLRQVAEDAQRQDEGGFITYRFSWWRKASPATLLALLDVAEAAQRMIDSPLGRTYELQDALGRITTKAPIPYISPDEMKGGE